MSDDEAVDHPAGDRPGSRSAVVHILQAGYAYEGDDGQHVGPSISLVIDHPAVIVIDPGMVASRDVLLAALRSHDIEPDQVTDVVFSHHHPDHTVNAALFPAARIHDHWAVYDRDLWHDRPVDRALSPSVRLIATPGHSNEDISTVVGTTSDIVVFTHAWWTADGPQADPFAPDQAVLERSRQRILSIADVVVPGHGPQFRPGGRATA